MISHVSALLSVAFLAIFAHLDAAAVIPGNKAILNRWFRANVRSYGTRKGTLDPVLFEAEADAKVIRVSKDGSGQFETITDAVNSVPSGNKQRVIILIEGGVYQEKLTIGRDKPFITFYGSPSGNNLATMVAGGTAAQYGTVDSATLIVESDYFMAVNMVFKNAAPLPNGQEGQQALALRVSGDKAAFYHCRMNGFQDTLCDDKGNHFFKDCYIEGTVDFIFGNGKSIFLNTDLYVLNSGGDTMITAHAGKFATEDTGYSFVHCSISGTAANTVLGRAWMPSPKVVFSYTQMSNVISPVGWSDNSQSDRDKILFFAEYKNMGPGANRANRAPFSKLLNDQSVRPYLSLEWIGASNWLLPPRMK